MSFNDIGDEGSKAVGEALKTNTTLTNLEYVSGAAVSPSRGSCRRTRGDGDGLTLTSIPSGRTRSLSWNEIGDEGGKAVAEALKTNTTLTNLKYVGGADVSPSRGSCRRTRDNGDSSTLTFLPSGQTRSLGRNEIGAEGGKAVCEALKTNTTLTNLEYVSGAAV